MCRNKAKLIKFQQLARWNKNGQSASSLAVDSPEIESAFDQPIFHIVKQSNPDQIELASWGLIPNWINDAKRAKEFTEGTQNARNDTIFDKPSFAPYIMTQRCLILTAGFIEHRHVAQGAYPYFIYLKHFEAFAMGGIYTEHPKFGNTYALITTDANPLMQKIHNTKLRMPLMFADETQEKAWLNPQATREDIERMMVPLDESLMDAHTIARKKPFDKKPFDYPELGMFDNMFDEDF